MSPGSVPIGRFPDQVRYPADFPGSAITAANIRIPSNAKLRSDLRAIKKETTAAGNIRFSADRGENGHSDRFWAGALAVHARGRFSGPCRMESCGRRSVERTRTDNFNTPERMIEHEISNCWPV